MTLLAVGHGTRDPAGAAVIRALLDRLRLLRPGLTVVESYAEITEPSLEDALAGLSAGRSLVVAVPLMLGRGYHTLVDIPGRAGPYVTVARPLGPHPLLAGALADRLGPDRHADAVVLGAAGTSGWHPATSTTACSPRAPTRSRRRWACTTRWRGASSAVTTRRSRPPGRGSGTVGW
ncbi:CbiX/SirB N-terminal domain-containing protein [Actinoallomurus sp. NPDC052274]|uniref:sirohydrochlorin chelatase n=1 Tax=Actinoallomurus sp. NPDC052274 TaxID=3155420 RepID=UPI00342BDCDD